MINNHNIILLFIDFYNILSFHWLILMRKCYNYEVFFSFQIVLRNSFDPDPDWEFWLDLDPDLVEYGSKTLQKSLRFWMCDATIRRHQKTCLCLCAHHRNAEYDHEGDGGQTDDEHGDAPLGEHFRFRLLTGRGLRVVLSHHWNRGLSLVGRTGGGIRLL